MALLPAVAHLKTLEGANRKEYGCREYHYTGSQPCKHIRRLDNHLIKSQPAPVHDKNGHDCQHHQSGIHLFRVAVVGVEEYPQKDSVVQ